MKGSIITKEHISSELKNKNNNKEKENSDNKKKNSKIDLKIKKTKDTKKTKISNPTLQTNSNLSISVVLVNPSIPGNIGAIARAMANFDVFNLILVNPKCQINEEARNRAKHAQEILNNVQIVTSLASVCKKHSLCIATTGIIGTDYNIARAPIMPFELKNKLQGVEGKVALIFGAEDKGLSNDDIEQCDLTITIPTSRKYPVMNLSHAVAVVLYELSKNKYENDLVSKYPLIAGKEKEELEKKMIAVINSVEYRTPFEKRTQVLIWKRIIGKAMPTRREAFAMIGLLKKIASREELKNKKNIKHEKKEKENKK